ncbi:MAG: 23S rRNA (adenine(2030)-N(6))-methyltransferase RlmJ [Planctomycetes bacterium]|nr:23S rRNA (adenine(2030)-N(6))-methyltransferase RlmJ [Planctomycetota bacterium]MBU1518561.1 23S rRNA (adenine(2030)-N(6))-methyltransferase RlmJ [Planctomycetota bacterium]MBU2458454.1 23S rRNA (adenine(2030)-N(6))-methyltransferase RlmJ [Planctomycetota bacterium]
MRIISGIKRGMTILPPKGDKTRPITDRIKESIFDVLYKYNLIEDRLVADLFCGTGSFGLEALSRGAKEAVFVDTDRKAIEILRKNIEKTGFTAQSRVVCANAFKVGAPTGAGQKCSLIFVDPPYEMSKQTDKKSRLAELLDFLPVQLADDGLVVVRTEKKINPVRDKVSKIPDSRHKRPVSNGVNLLDSYGSLKIIDRRVWSSMAVAFLALRKDDQQTGSNTDNSQTPQVGL